MNCSSQSAILKPALAPLLSFIYVPLYIARKVAKSITSFATFFTFFAFCLKKDARPFKDTHPPTHAPKENYTRIIVPIKAKNLHRRCYSWDSWQIKYPFSKQSG